MTQPTAQPEDREARLDRALRYFEAQRSRYLGDLIDLAKIPSVSFPGFKAAPVRTSAEATAHLLRTRGFENVELLEIPGAHPYVYGDYTIFVAEVASTCNEALLAHHLLSVETSDDVRRYLINHQLEAFRTTFFRQTLFAEFEMIAHEAAEKGEALTADKLSEIFLDLNRKYYGDVVDDNDAVQVEWARIPHFYNSFYVYKYATGISANASSP